MHHPYTTHNTKQINVGNPECSVQIKQVFFDKAYIFTNFACTTQLYPDKLAKQKLTTKCSSIGKNGFGRWRLYSKRGRSTASLANLKIKPLKVH